MCVGGGGGGAGVGGLEAFYICQQHFLEFIFKCEVKNKHLSVFIYDIAFYSIGAAPHANTKANWKSFKPALHGFPSKFKSNIL